MQNKRRQGWARRAGLWGVLAVVLALAGPGSRATPAQSEQSGAENPATEQADNPPGDQSKDKPREAGQGKPKQTGRVGRTAGDKVAIIRIEGMIYDFTVDSLKRRVERAKNGGIDVLVIELDTNGGLVKSGLEINRFLRQQPVETVAWVNDKAYSAGILIGAACNQIVMAPASATGDSAPVKPGKNLAPTERAKQLQPILTAYEQSARDNNYPYAVFHAMCQLGVEVYAVRHPDKGEIKLVNQVDRALMVKGREPDAGRVQNLLGGDAKTQKVGEIKNRVATKQDYGRWQPVEQIQSNGQQFRFPDGLVHDGSTLLTLSGEKAKALGLSSATIANDNELGKHLNTTNVRRVAQTWSENLASFLSSPWVRIVLVIALLVGAYLEFQSPGLGLPGAIAALSLIMLLGAPFIIGLANVWHIVVFFIGLGLLLLELIVIPSFGLVGIVGLLLMLVGLVMSVVPTSGGSITPPPGMYDRLLMSLLSILLGLGASIVALFFLARHFGTIPMLNRLMLQHRPEPAYPNAAYGRAMEATASAPTVGVSGDEALGEGQIQVGDTGRVSVTGLRPSGRAEINGQLVDVVSVGGWLEANKKVRVVEVHGNRIVVDEWTGEP